MKIGETRAIFSFSGKIPVFREELNIDLIGVKIAPETHLTTSGLISSKPGLVFVLSVEKAFLSSSSVRGCSFSTE